jgi:hypothetical protein
MTTILADFKLGVMVADSSISDGDRVWSGRKVFRFKGTLFGFSGNIDEAIEFLGWYKKGLKDKHPKFSNSHALVMNDAGLFYFGASCIGQPIKSGIEAIGTGAKAAICAYEAMGFKKPEAAVKLVCKHDAGSRVPVRTYKLRP